MEKGDILYVIITIIIIAVSIFKKKTEAAKLPKSDNYEEYEPMYSENKPEQTYTQVKKEVMPVEEGGSANLRVKKKELIKKKEELMVRTPNVKVVDVKSMQGDKSPKPTIDFDAKKAVLYSIILERKEF